MWFWDFTPASHSYKKPITKAQLKKMQDNFAKADVISKEIRLKEEEEKKIALNEMDDLLSDIIA